MGHHLRLLALYFLKYRMVNIGRFNGYLRGWQLIYGIKSNYFGANTNKVKAYMYDTNGNAITSVVGAGRTDADFVVGRN